MCCMRKGGCPKGTTGPAPCPEEQGGPDKKCCIPEGPDKPTGGEGGTGAPGGEGTGDPDGEGEKGGKVETPGGEGTGDPGGAGGTGDPGGEGTGDPGGEGEKGGTAGDPGGEGACTADQDACTTFDEAGMMLFRGFRPVSFSSPIHNIIYQQSM